MRLRKQLLLASAFTLSLPWVGCQYIREVETALIDGQNQSLLATSKAIRASLEDDVVFISELAKIRDHRDDVPLHLHRLNAPMRLDGYKEEWSINNTPPQTLINAEETKSAKSAKIWAAEADDKAWLFVEVPYAPLKYYLPGQSNADSDQLRLTLNHENQKQHFRVLTSSPGLARVVSEQNGAQAIEHRIKAYWRESTNGYQIELNLPIKWASSTIGLEVFSNAALTFSNMRDMPAPPPTRVLDSAIAMIHKLELADIRVDIAAENGAFLGRSGSIDLKTTRKPPWFMQFIFDFALRKRTFPELADAETLGHIRTLRGYGHTEEAHPRLVNYEYRGNVVTTAMIPIRQNDLVVGSLVTTQNTNSLSAFTDAAFNKLLMYSIVVTFCSALALAFYASWLSYRVLQLRNSTRDAVSDQGAIASNFKASSINDEIGDLSRGFGDLLKRLSEYTDYLQTLSNKLSHELRTPLAIVSSSIDNLEQETDRKKAETYIARAKSGTERLSKILNAMSAASRVEQAISSTKLEPVDLCALLDQLPEAYKDAYPQSQFSFVSEAKENQTVVLGSAELIVQMLDKLVDNARDFCSPEGTIVIRLTMPSNKIVKVSINNPGPHLPETMKLQLFDSMVSLRDAQPDAHHLGFGLYISKLVAQAHNATIDAHNLYTSEGDPFDGVSFSVQFPVHPVSH